MNSSIKEFLSPDQAGTCDSVSRAKSTSLQLTAAICRPQLKMHLRSLFWLLDVTPEYLGFDLRYIDLITFSSVSLFIESVYLIDLNPPHFIFFFFPKLHVSMCYNWKTEKELTHEGSSHKSDPQHTAAKHSLILKKERAELFRLACTSLFLKLKFTHNPG